MVSWPLLAHSFSSDDPISVGIQISEQNQIRPRLRAERPRGRGVLARCTS